MQNPEESLEDILIERKIHIERKRIMKPMPKRKISGFFRKKEKLREMPQTLQPVLKMINISKTGNEIEKDLQKKRKIIETAHAKPINILENPVSRAMFPEIIVPASVAQEHVKDIKVKNKERHLHKKLLEAQRKSQEILLRIRRKELSEARKKIREERKKLIKKYPAHHLIEKKTENFRPIFKKSGQESSLAKAKDKFELEIEKIKEKLSRLEENNF
jgi:hypothetical protein